MDGRLVDSPASASHRLTRAMPPVRPFTQMDIASVAALHTRVFGAFARMPAPTLESYFQEIFFRGPWVDEDLPSWVCEDRHGRIVGFCGVFPRRMTFNGTPCRIAVTSQLMVDPSARAPWAAPQMLQNAFDGKQDLVITDGATDHVQKLWTRMGGTTATLYSLRWIHAAKPTRLFATRAARRLGAGGRVLGLGSPIFWAADAALSVLPTRRLPRVDPDLHMSELDPTTLLENIPQVAGGRALLPAYDPASIAWLWEQAAKLRQHGRLRAMVLHTGDEKLVGWFLYFVKSGDVTEVLQVAAMDGEEDRVVRQLLADAYQHGAVAVSGRFEPSLLAAMGHNRVHISRSGGWTLMHSRRPEILEALHRGDAFFSRLEAEWWMRFWGG